MQLSFSRLALVAVLAAALCATAFAQPQKPESIEQIIAGLYQKAGPEDQGHLAFQDESGKAITPERFAEQVQAGRDYGILKKRNVAGMTFRINSDAETTAMHSFANLKRGQPFPAFALKRLDGTSIDRHALDGRYTLVSFYFAGCAPCAREVPSLNAVAQRRKDINVLALTTDSPEQVREFTRSTGLAWPVVPNADSLVNAVGVKGFPSLALLDRQGKLVDFTVGGGFTEHLAELNAWLDARIPAAAFAAPQDQPIPASIRGMLKQMNAEKYSSLTLLDEQGKPMAPEAFAQEMKAGHSANVNKATANGTDPAITLRLISKDDAAKAMNLKPKLKEGDAFPPFQLARLDGSTIDNQALAGRYTLVSFYFATCAPCIREVPELNALARRRTDLNVVAVTNDSVADSKQFVDEHHLGWTVVPTAKKLIDAVGVRGYPTLMLLDPAGKVVSFIVGGRPEEGSIGPWVDKFAAPKT